MNDTIKIITGVSVFVVMVLVAIVIVAQTQKSKAREAELAELNRLLEKAAGRSATYTEQYEFETALSEFDDVRARIKDSLAADDQLRSRLGDEIGLVYAAQSDYQNKLSSGYILEAGQLISPEEQQRREAERLAAEQAAREAAQKAAEEAQTADAPAEPESPATRKERERSLHRLLRPLDTIAGPRPGDMEVAMKRAFRKRIGHSPMGVEIQVLRADDPYADPRDNWRSWVWWYGDEEDELDSSVFEDYLDIVVVYLVVDDGKEGKWDPLLCGLAEDARQILQKHDLVHKEFLKGIIVTLLPIGDRCKIDFE